MSNKFYNIYYDPVREGYSTTTWRTLWGLPVMSGATLSLSDSSIIHYGDILRGDAVFNLNLSVPTLGDDKRFGFRQYNKNAYIYFDISDNVFSVKTSDGTNDNSTTLTWVSDWTDTDTEFRVKWEAGTAKFYINGNLYATISDISVPGCPLSVYAENMSDSSTLISFIEVTGIQSYRVATGTNFDYPDFSIKVGDAITMSEDIDI